MFCELTLPVGGKEGAWFQQLRCVALLNFSKDCLKFVFNKVPDHIRPTFRVCAAHVNEDYIVALSMCNASFGKRLLSRYKAPPTVLNPTANLPD